jgi:hypothetical protein
MYIDYFRKLDNGEWEAWDGSYLDIITTAENSVSGKSNTFYANAATEDEGTIGETVIKDHKYSFKVQLSYKYYYGQGPGEWDYIYSPFSNEVSIGSGNFYSKASDWATTELTKAEEAGIIPDILKGADMTKSITREEFCELAVLLYEKATGTQSQPSATNPFKDTTNAQILKAYNLQITAGTSATTFSPQTLINREQCAAMLYRTIKAIAPNGDYSIAAVADFPDQKDISNWAVEATKYMSKLGIIKGDEAGNFMPKATTTAQQATGYGMATREAAVLMAIRTYDKVK